MRNYSNDLAIPSVYVYQRKSGPGTGWWVKCAGDIIAFGPFPSAADAASAWREAILRRTEEPNSASQSQRVAD